MKPLLSKLDPHLLIGGSFANNLVRRHQPQTNRRARRRSVGRMLLVFALSCAVGMAAAGTAAARVAPQSARGTSGGASPAAPHAATPCIPPKITPNEAAEKALVGYVEKRSKEILKEAVKETPGAVAKALKSGLKWEKVIKDTLEGGAGVDIVYGLQIIPLTPDVYGHMGPAGHHTAFAAGVPGAPVVMQVRVVNRNNGKISEAIRLALKSMGYKIPTSGVVACVPILWELGATGAQIPAFLGSWDPAGKSLPGVSGLYAKTYTDSEGVATLTFRPAEEVVPGFGIEKEKRITVDGLALWGDAFSNKFGKLMQYLTPKFTGMHFSLFYHRARGFLFDTGSGQLRVCGASPWAPAVWTSSGGIPITVSYAPGAWNATGDPDLFEYTGGTGTVTPATLPPDSREPGGYVLLSNLTLAIPNEPDADSMLNPPLKLQFTSVGMQADGTTDEGGTGSVTAAVVEDTTCPVNDN